jgi:alcohol dehydrogenase (cytochrome c)
LIPKPDEPGGDTWGDVPYEARRHVGAWMVPSFDPGLNRVFVGTSVTAPAPKYMLAGNDKQYLYHNSTLALDADTGAIVWYYQHLVDHWDLDHPFERLLVDTAVAPDASEVTWINPKLTPGERRKVVTGVPGKTGVVYTLDRETGEFLWARPTVKQTVVAGIDGATGAVTVNPDMLFTGVGQTRIVGPNSNGGKNFQAGAYSPLGNVMYYSLQNTCMRVTSIAEKPDPKEVYQISVRAQFPEGVDKIGTVYAISAETGRTVWKYEQRAAMTSLVATAGGLVFGGDSNGRFRAFDQKTGEVLWEINLGAAVTGYPVTFAVGGRQYVAVSTGTAVATTGLNLMAPELRPGSANNLFVFALPVAD